MKKFNINIKKFSSEQMAALLRKFVTEKPQSKTFQIRKLELAVRSLNLQRVP
jgi:hypothetical protein